MAAQAVNLAGLQAGKPQRHGLPLRLQARPRCLLPCRAGAAAGSGCPDRKAGAVPGLCAAPYLPLTYSATAAISSSVIFSTTACITALSLVRARVPKLLSCVSM